MTCREGLIDCYRDAGFGVTGDDSIVFAGFELSEYDKSMFHAEVRWIQEQRVGGSTGLSSISQSM